MRKQMHMGTQTDSSSQTEISHIHLTKLQSKMFSASLSIPKPITFLLGLTKVGHIKDIKEDEE